MTQPVTRLVMKLLTALQRNVENHGFGRRWTSKDGTCLLVTEKLACAVGPAGTGKMHHRRLLLTMEERRP